MALIPGWADGATTRAWAASLHPPAGHVREALALGGLSVSSIGFGSYLGAADEATDAAMARAVADLPGAGVNVIDTALNYRSERSERSIGAGLRRLAAEGVPRASLVVATKGGFLVSAVPDGLFDARDVAMGCHAMTPAFVRWAVDRSRENLGVETVDLWYLHNPEAQRERLDLDAWLAALRACFETLEEGRRDNRLATYGLATWEGLRVPPDHPFHVPLERVVAVAREVGGAHHGLRAIQLPLNLAMPEALLLSTQDVGGTRLSAIEAARRLALDVFTSASTVQGRATGRVPKDLVDAVPGADGSPTRALLQWTRSAPGVTTALVGMTKRAHREENLALARVSPAPAERVLALAR